MNIDKKKVYLALIDGEPWAAECDHLLSENERLLALLNNPETKDFIKAVELEAGHQRLKWSSEHDGGKTDAAWFWLLGYLGGKALHNPNPVDATEEEKHEKQLHRIIATAAACLNWHAYKQGKTTMRPGTLQPEESP